MHKVVLDTNVLISAIAFGVKPREILNRVINGRIEFAISKDILDEFEGVLSGKKFKYPKQMIHLIRNEIENLGEFVSPQKVVNKIKKDPADNSVLECALEAEAHFIISGDIHLLEIRNYKNIEILTPADYLKEF